MANGDPLRVGVTQPPDNRATSATMLVHNGSAFGTQHTAFWVRRQGAPVCNAAIRGENFSAGAAAGVQQVGVLGMTVAAPAGVGVLGTTPPSGLFSGEAGVMGITASFGVVGRSTTGLVVDQPGAFVSGTGVVGQCDAGVGVHGVAASGWGVIGASTGRAGVTGASVDGVGVEGVSEQGFAGVRGRSGRMIGVLGSSEEGVGVAGVSRTNAIQGFSTGGAGASIGVVGSSDAGQGVLGNSVTGIGIGGRSPGGWAGYFEGNVVVTGAFYVTGGPKAAAVRHPDGTHRALFCLESPESYFEDFGEAALTGEEVAVALAEDFAALVRRSRYQVFLTSYGPEALYVRKRGAEGFVIARIGRAAGGKPRAVRVGYRVVARRADLRPVRLPAVKMPTRTAEVVALAAPARRGTRRRAANLPQLVELEPLPSPPKTPSPDLEAFANARPVDAGDGGQAAPEE